MRYLATAAMVAPESRRLPWMARQGDSAVDAGAVILQPLIQAHGQYAERPSLAAPGGGDKGLVFDAEIHVC